MSQKTTLQVGCKVNLHLEITGRLDNGYHTLRTLFVPLPSPGDTLTLEMTGQGSDFELIVDDPELYTESNTIAKAYRLFCARSGFNGGVRAILVKNAPMGAGLGGGSADAGAMLQYLNSHPDTPTLSRDEMIQIAASIGADVPFFLMDGPCWAEGIGEILTPVELDLRGISLLLICPDIHVSSAWAYRAWDEYKEKSNFLSKNAQGFLTCAASTDKSSPCRRPVLTNSFEKVVFPAHPKLREFKEKLLQSGAGAAVLSGSGASILGLYRNKEQVQKASDYFKALGVPTYQHHF